MDAEKPRAYFAALQNTLGAAFAEIDGGVFAEEIWRGAPGVGRGLRLEDGAVFERAGINFSDIAGKRLPPAATARRPELAGREYCAAGLSLVAHPRNPYCPAAHLNVRFFAAGEVWWFGGGMDLTPHYGFAEDCRHFHAACKNALDAVDAALYPKFKKQCDEYFFIKHRNEMRGIGGVFFDDFNAGGFSHAFAVARAAGDAFCGAYLPLVQKRMNAPFGEREVLWQQQRRGRYVEFNLIYDRGTLFGLQSGGRAESILMSLPPVVRWRAGTAPGAEEKKLADFLRPREWV
ncbi:MAG: oxygen-dependent coproporphyrinogen oxidase [Betaproteobacteria bacterium]|nr:oxygen-dependent coproporphyrinogen oxidase [Betaproteobacteria bacterium]